MVFWLGEKNEMEPVGCCVVLFGCFSPPTHPFYFCVRVAVEKCHGRTTGGILRYMM